MEQLWRRYGVFTVPLGVQALLAGLKVAGVVRWSWWWVLAPVWLCVLVCACFLGLDMLALSNWGKRTR
jgi:hypothetical protein